MPWTILTTKNKAGRDAIKKIGDVIDNQFHSDPEGYWRLFWANKERKGYLKTMRTNLAVLTKAAKGKKPCDDSRASKIQDAAHYFGGMRKRTPLVKSNCAQGGAAEIAAIIESGMFEKVFQTDSYILCITHPLIIHHENTDYPMGRYCVSWSYRPLAQTGTGGHLRFPAHANFDSHGEIQPHIHTSGGWCGGDLENALPGLFKTGLIADAMVLILQYLLTAEGHPFRDIDYWRPGGSASAKPVCASCRCFNKTPLRTCPVCFATSCSVCWGCYTPNQCPRCGHKSKRKVKSKLSERKKTNDKKG